MAHRWEADFERLESFPFSSCSLKENRMLAQLVAVSCWLLQHPAGKSWPPINLMELLWHGAANQCPICLRFIWFSTAYGLLFLDVKSKRNLGKKIGKKPVVWLSVKIWQVNLKSWLCLSSSADKFQASPHNCLVLIFMPPVSGALLVGPDEKRTQSV